MLFGKKEYDVSAFLSYSRTDDEDLKRGIHLIKERLEKSIFEKTKLFLKINIDTEAIEVGADWIKKTQDLLDSSGILIPIITPNYLSSKYCTDELKLFIDRNENSDNVQIAPIYLIKDDNLEKVKPDRRSFLGRLKRLNFLDWRDDIHPLIKGEKISDWQERDEKLEKHIDDLAERIIKNLKKPKFIIGNMLQSRKYTNEAMKIIGYPYVIILSTVGIFSLLYYMNQTDIKYQIAVAREGGTYYKLGSDIVQMAKQCGWDLEILNTDGSPAILDSVASRESPAILGIVQADVMKYNSEISPEKRKDYKSNVKYIFSLYDEFLQFIIKGNTNDGTVLKNGNVEIGVGSPDSGTAMTVANLKNLNKNWGFRSKEQSENESIESMKNMESGVQGFFFVSGLDAPVLNDIRTYISDGNFNLVSVTLSKDSYAMYAKATIPVDVYGNKISIDTISTKSVLISKEYDEEDTNSCRLLGAISGLINEHVSSLKQGGEGIIKDAKYTDWESVDLKKEVPIGDWSLSECASNGNELIEICPKLELHCDKTRTSGTSRDQCYNDRSRLLELKEGN